MKFERTNSCIAGAIQISGKRIDFGKKLLFTIICLILVKPKDLVVPNCFKGLKIRFVSNARLMKLIFIVLA